jgi:hypothetical protein
LLLTSLVYFKTLSTAISHNSAIYGRGAGLARAALSALLPGAVILTDILRSDYVSLLLRYLTESYMARLGEKSGDFLPSLHS